MNSLLLSNAKDVGKKLMANVLHTSIQVPGSATGSIVHLQHTSKLGLRNRVAR